MFSVSVNSLRTGSWSIYLQFHKYFLLNMLNVGLISWCWFCNIWTTIYVTKEAINFPSSKIPTYPQTEVQFSPCTQLLPPRTHKKCSITFSQLKHVIYIPHYTLNKKHLLNTNHLKCISPYLYSASFSHKRWSKTPNSSKYIYPHWSIKESLSTPIHLKYTTGNLKHLPYP